MQPVIEIRHNLQFLKGDISDSLYQTKFLASFTAVFTQISSYIDAESSDDDVYCDSFNPDEVCSGLKFSIFIKLCAAYYETQMKHYIFLFICY